jgi:hypothetical protein
VGVLYDIAESNHVFHMEVKQADVHACVIAFTSRSRISTSSQPLFWRLATSALALFICLLAQTNHFCYINNNTKSRNNLIKTLYNGVFRSKGLDRH